LERGERSDDNLSLPPLVLMPIWERVRETTTAGSVA
jgi:hypothetical protein